MSYQAWPLRTVKRIASKYFCGHTNGVIKKLEDVDWGMFDINRYYVCKKSAKNCHVDVNEYIHDTSDKQIAVDKSTVERSASTNIDDLWNEAGQNKTSCNIVHTDGIDFEIEETDKQDDDLAFDDDDNDREDMSYHHSSIMEVIIKNHNIKMPVSIFFEEKDYSDDNTCYVDEVKHSYGLSFLSYLNIIMEGNMKRVTEITKDMLYHMTDKSLLEQALSGLDYLADQYSYDPELKAAVYDIEHMMRAVENGHFSFNLHGLMSSVPEAHDTYPVMYEPVDSIDTMFDKLKDDFDGCNVKTITDNAENVRKWFKVIIASRGWRECIIDGVTIFRDDLVKAMKRLNINDMCSIINKAGALKGYKWHKKLYVQDTFIEYRELFYRQCAAKGYM